MKKVLSILLSALMLISVFTAVPLTAGAAETEASQTGETSGDFEYWISYDGTAVISDYTGSATELEIPGELDGYTVTSIGYGAFRDCTNLASITIPDSVTSIGGYAFECCTSLESITIPDSVTSIGGWAFYGTAWYDNQPDGVVYAGKVAYEYKGEMPENTSIVLEDGTLGIAGSALYNCTSLTSIAIPDSVTSIGDYAFRGCESLENITIPDSVTGIGFDAFSGCTSLTSITIPDSVTSIGSGAFEGCTSLTSVTIGSGITSIGVGVFYDCTSLTNITVESNNQYYSSLDGNLYNKNETELIQYAIGKTDESFVIPDSVTSIGVYAFEDCTSLTSVTIGKGVTSISDNTFVHCMNLKSVTIPESVISIGRWAFYDCTNLTSIDVDANNKKYTSVDGVLYNKDKTLLLMYAAGKDDTTFVIPDSVKRIVRYAFYNCISLTSVTIGNSVTSIGEEAFSYCISLESVTIGNSVTSIDGEAFCGCTSLESVTIGNGITSIDNGAFSGCTNLEKVYYRGTKEQWDNISIGINNNCLINASVYDLDLNIIPFGGTATDDEEEPIDIESNIRWNVDENGTLYINGTGMTNPGESSWDEDIPWYSQRESIKNVVVSEGVTGIGNYSFYNCDNIETISLPASVTYVGSEAFFSGSLENIYVSEDSKTFTSVDGVLFSKDMTEIIRYPLSRSGDYYIPNTVTDIHQGAFRECRNLTKIEFSDSVTSIGWYAFFDCDSLLSVTIPSTITCDLSECGLGLKFHKGWDKKIEGFVIYGESGSAAEEYAYYYGLTFVNINEMPTSDPTESTASTEPPTGSTQPGTSEPTEPGTQSNPTDNTDSTEPSESTATTDPGSTQPTSPTVTDPTESIKATQPATSAKPKTVVKKTKKANPMTVSVKTKTVKTKKLKKAKQTVKAITVSKAKGKVSYAKIKSGTTKKIFKKVTIGKNGKITLKKGKYKKGTYKIKVKITAKGNSAYKSKSKTVTVRIKVK